MKISPAQLVQAAADASKYSASSYSKFKVGAALLTKSGEIIRGANVESASYGLTCCAERIALFKALTDGKKHFVAMAVVAQCNGGPAPCGACRQLLMEYAPDAKIYVANQSDLKTFREFTVRELLPAAFISVP